jgi:hypothetical protein
MSSILALGASGGAICGRGGAVLAATSDQTIHPPLLSANTAYCSHKLYKAVQDVHPSFSAKYGGPMSSILALRAC